MLIGKIDLSIHFPLIMGILNVTPDSFSDGNLHFNCDDAIDYAKKLIDDGADIIDIGGESTRPGSKPVSVEEEIRRVIPVIEGIRRNSDVPVSIDTTKSKVAALAIESGADMLNDVSAGRFDPDMFIVAAQTQRPICLMHMQGTPETMQKKPHYGDLLGEIRSFLKTAAESAISAGVDAKNIIIDPGIGFGKSAEDNLEILRHLNEFKALDFTLMVGASRKSFIGKLLGLEVNERLEATLATIPACIQGNASILRFHDVKCARRFLDMYLKICE